MLNFQTIVLIFIVIFKNILAIVSSGFLQVSLVYLSIEMIQSGKPFLKFDSRSKIQTHNTFIINK